MGTRLTTALGLACVVTLAASACGTDDEADNSSDSLTEGGTVKVGLLGAVSGVSAPAWAEFRRGVQARLDSYDGACAGVDFELVEGDDMSTEQGNLTAAQRLVEREQVSAVLTNTSTLAASTGYLETAAAALPIIGYPLDGPSPAWFDPDNNFFKVVPVPEQDDVFSTTGEFFKQAGATDVATVAFNIEPALVGMRATAASVEAAGLRSILQYGNIDLGTGDVSGAVNAIIDSGADGVWAAVTPEVGVQLITALRQAGFDGTINLPTGYGGQLLNNDNQRQASQGVAFATPTAPVELDSEVTDAQVAALEAAGSDNAIPSIFETSGYLSADLLIYGLESAGCDATSQEIVNTLRESDDWNAGGLLPNPIDYANPEVTELCTFFVTLEGDAFEPFSDDPICGEKVDG